MNSGIKSNRCSIKLKSYKKDTNNKIRCEGLKIIQFFYNTNKIYYLIKYHRSIYTSPLVLGG